MLMPNWYMPLFKLNRLTIQAHNHLKVPSVNATDARHGKTIWVSDRNDPDQNIDGGTRYLKHLINMFNPNLDLAVAAYNAGENAVIRYNNSIPPYPETQNYVKQVLALYNQ